MKKFLFFLLFVLPSPGQILGAFTSFSNEETATTWGFVDFGDLESAYSVFWTFPGSEDAEIYTTFETSLNPANGQTEVFEVSLFADQLSSDAAFVGDYDAAGIDTVRCDVYVEDLDSFDELEVYFLSGNTFYYSEIFELDRSGWAQIETNFSRDGWYFYDDEEATFFPVEMTPAILGNVREIGVTFYPSGPEAAGKIVALDNFSLLPNLTPPTLAIEIDTSLPALKFAGITGMQYTLESNDSLRPNDWFKLAEPFEVTGPSQTPAPSGQRGFFRILAQPFFVEIP